jgi:sulfite reductase (NADPH) flavoprotein alpha-component
MSLMMTAPVYNRNNPFMAKIVENRLLNKLGSSKETHHLVVDITGSGMAYEPGDSLALFPTNRDEDILDILDALNLDGNELVTMPKEEDQITLQEALHSRLYFLSGVTRGFLSKIRDKVTDSGEASKLEALLDTSNARNLSDYIEAHHHADVLRDFPSAKFVAEEIPTLFKRLNPRLYSIASGLAANPNHIHLTIGVVRYNMLNKQRVGVASTYAVDRVPLNESVLPVFVAKSHFRLPPSDTDVIMIGPGTGVAPFRGFLQEREAIGATGRNWLFFGDQHQATDFIYEDEFETWKANGVLSNLSLAWSRDQDKRVYVQHLLWEQRDVFWEWFSSGACLYVCGDKSRMARDVEEMFVRIAIQKGAVENDPDSTNAWIRQLKKEKRYQLDVY